MATSYRPGDGGMSGASLGVEPRPLDAVVGGASLTASLDPGLTRSQVRPPWIDALVFLLPLSIYLAFPAVLISPDGLLYYTLVRSRAWGLMFLPGHLLYCPLMTVLAGMANALHLSVLQTMRLSDQLAGAASVYFVFRIARRLGINQFGQWLAALGLAVSYGVWKEAVDVKTYALALFLVLASIDQMIGYAERGDPGRLVGLAALNSVAALLHLTLLSIAAASLCLIVWMDRGAPRRLPWDVGVYAGSVGLFFALPTYSIGLWTFNAHTLGETLAWLKLAGHGYRVTVDVMSIPRALYGFARTFVYLEFFWDAPKWVIAFKSLGILAAAVWATRGIRSVWGQLSPTAKAVIGSLLGFVLLQVAFGVYFFGSDSERWIFVAPVVWLVLAAHLSRQPLSQRRIAAVGVCLVFAINLALAIWPAATESATKARVLALDKLLPAHALLISPGGDWSDYYQFFTAKTLERVTLDGVADFMADPLPIVEAQGGLQIPAILSGDDHAGFYQTLDRRIAAAREARGAVVMIRILDPTENFKRSPWQVLESMGYPAERIRRWAQRYQWEERRLSDPEHTRIYWLR